MSIEATTWAWNQVVRPRTKLVLVIMAGLVRSNTSCLTEVPMDIIKAHSSLPAHKVVNALDELQEKGLISLVEEVDTLYFRLNLESV